MPNFNKIPKNYLIGGIIAVVVILLLINVFQPANFLFRDKVDYQARQQEAEALRQQYQALLAAIDVNPQDSEVVLKKIATEDVVKEDVAQALQTSQPIAPPVIKNSELNIAAKNDKATVQSYLNKTVAMVQNYNTKTSSANQLVFTELSDKTLVDQAVKETTNMANDLRGTPVPKDLIEYHKAKIVTYEQYADFLAAAESYTPGSYDLKNTQDNTSMWPRVYKDYAVINNRAEVIGSELGRVNQKFGLNDAQFKLAGNTGITDVPWPVQLGLVKQSQAFLGLGDLTITIGDIPRLILYGVEQGLAQAFTTFIMGAVDRIVAKIDKYFTITSELYYSQELGKLYTKEYWTKLNVPDVEQQIMKNFLPQYFCVPKSPQDIKKLTEVFKAKSHELLKYDISTIPLESSNYYEALNDLGEKSQALINPYDFWKDAYTAQAGQAGSAAADAIDKEIKGSGLKSGRDLLSGAVQQNVSKILHVQQGSVTQALNLGNSKADSMVSTVIAGIFESVTTKFIFTAVSSGQRGGGLATVEEQPLCISTAKVKPVVPAGATPEELAKVDQARIDQCKVYLQLYDEAKAKGAAGLNDDVAAECRKLVAQASNK